MKKENSTINVECNITGTTSNWREKVGLNDTIEENLCGIYKIINKINNKYYVGSSLNILGEPHGRFYQHKAHLKCQRHYNKHLQSAWNKYSSENFDFIIVEETLPIIDILLETEQKYLETAKLEKNKCYNKSFTSSGPDWSEENRSKRSLLISGKNNPNYGNGDKIRGNKNPFYNKKHNSETKILMSKNHIDYRGNNHPRHKKEIHELFHELTGESFHGTQYEFYTKYKNISVSSVSNLFNRKTSKVKGWTIRNFFPEDLCME